MAKVVTAPAPRIPAPGVNDLVRVTIGIPVEDDEDEEEEDGGAAFASEVVSRVEDVTQEAKTGRPLTYLIAAPWFPGDAEQPAKDTACALQWPTSRGVCTLPVSFQGETYGATGVRFWRVKVTGPVRRHERRQYVRVPWSLPTKLIVRRDLDALPPDRRHDVERAGIRGLLRDLPEFYDATALNVSEGGLLCLSPTPVMVSDLPLIARFTIESTCFEAPASVVWSMLRDGKSGPSAGKPGVVESAIAFDDPSKYGEVLRPLIFQAQLRARREGLV